MLSLNSFIRLGHAEGISALLLFLVAMPMKYALDMPLAVKYVGAIHGGLFVAYVLLLVIIGLKRKWKVSTMLLFFIASIFPGGPFIAEKKLLKREEAK